VSVLVEDVAEIVEMDLNPVKVLPPGQGCVVVDVRILLQGSGGRLCRLALRPRGDPAAAGKCR
jgi:hypothetical protein